MSFYKLFRDTASYLVAIAHWFLWLNIFSGFRLLNNFEGLIVEEMIPYVYLAIYIVLCCFALIFRIIEKYSAGTTVEERIFNLYWYLSPVLPSIFVLLFAVGFVTAWGNVGGAGIFPIIMLAIASVAAVSDIFLLVKVIKRIIEEKKIGLNWVAAFFCLLLAWGPIRASSIKYQRLIEAEKNSVPSSINEIEKELNRNGFEVVRGGKLGNEIMLMTFDCSDSDKEILFDKRYPESMDKGMNRDDLVKIWNKNKQFLIIDQYLLSNGFHRGQFDTQYYKNMEGIIGQRSEILHCNIEMKETNSENTCQMTFSCN